MIQHIINMGQFKLKELVDNKSKLSTEHLQLITSLCVVIGEPAVWRKTLTQVWAIFPTKWRLFTLGLSSLLSCCDKPPEHSSSRLSVSGSSPALWGSPGRGCSCHSHSPKQREWMCACFSSACFLLPLFSAHQCLSPHWGCALPLPESRQPPQTHPQPTWLDHPALRS